jgi:hypothetical protein
MKLEALVVLLDPLYFSTRLPALDMQMKLPTLRLILLIPCCLLVLGGCASSGLPEPVIDHKPAYDFGKIKTFAYLPRKGGPADSAVFSDMEVERMHRAFARALAAKGMELVEDRAQADIMASWHVVVQDQTDARGYNSASYYHCWRCGSAVPDVSVRQYTQGTLIFDFVDIQARKSVWRGVMQSRIDDKRQAEGQQERFNAIATAMLKNFPPR